MLNIQLNCAYLWLDCGKSHTCSQLITISIVRSKIGVNRAIYSLVPFPDHQSARPTVQNVTYTILNADIDRSRSIIGSQDQSNVAGHLPEKAARHCFGAHGSSPIISTEHVRGSACSEKTRSIPFGCFSEARSLLRSGSGSRSRSRHCPISLSARMYLWRPRVIAEHQRNAIRAAEDERTVREDNTRSQGTAFEPRLCASRRRGARSAAPTTPYPRARRQYQPHHPVVSPPPPPLPPPPSPSPPPPSPTAIPSSRVYRSRGRVPPLVLTRLLVHPLARRLLRNPPSPYPAARDPAVSSPRPLILPRFRYDAPSLRIRRRPSRALSPSSRSSLFVALSSFPITFSSVFAPLNTVAL